jgi:hypothetical protein
MTATLLVIAKAPVPGRVKSRLVPPYTHAQAAALAEAALIDTLHGVLAAPARRRVLVLDGSPGPWLPAGFDVMEQAGGGLDERLAAAFDAVAGPALIVGMDRTPERSRAAVCRRPACGWRSSRCCGTSTPPPTPRRSPRRRRPPGSPPGCATCSPFPPAADAATRTGYAQGNARARAAVPACSARNMS